VPLPASSPAWSRTALSTATSPPQRPPAHAGRTDGSRRPQTTCRPPSNGWTWRASTLQPAAPEALPSGSSGYTHRTARKCLWGRDCRPLRWGRVAGRNARLERRDRARGLLRQGLLWPG
jgi:hypothetical protein